MSKREMSTADRRDLVWLVSEYGADEIANIAKQIEQAEQEKKRRS